MVTTKNRRWATLAVLCVTLLLISLDNTVLNVALPSIVRGIGASSSQLQWIVDAYAVVFAGLLLSSVRSVIESGAEAGFHGGSGSVRRRLGLRGMAGLLTG